MANQSMMGVAPMENLSAGEVGGIFAGIVALLAALGKGLAWAVGWSDRRDEHRAAKLKAWEDSLNRREIDQRVRTEHRLRLMEISVHVMRRALVNCAAEMRAIAPASSALAEIEEALRVAIPLEGDLPPAVEALLHKLDRKERP